MTDDCHKFLMLLTKGGLFSRVFLDGVEVTGLTAIKVEVGLERATTITLTMIPKDIEIEGEVGEVNVAHLTSPADEWRMGGHHGWLVRWLARRSAVVRYLIRRPGLPA